MGGIDDGKVKRWLGKTLLGAPSSYWELPPDYSALIIHVLELGCIVLFHLLDIRARKQRYVYIYIYSTHVTKKFSPSRVVFMLLSNKRRSC